MFLDATTKSVTVILAEAKTTSDCDVAVAYEDLTTTTFLAGSTDTATNGTGTVTIVAAPAASTQRRVREITVFNNDTVNHTITVNLLDNGTNRIQYKGLIVSGGILYYANGRWSKGPIQIAAESFDNTVVQNNGDNIQQMSLVNILGEMRWVLSILAKTFSMAASPADGRLRMRLEEINFAPNAQTSTLVVQTSNSTVGNLYTTNAWATSSGNASSTGPARMDTVMNCLHYNAWASVVQPCIGRA